MTLNAADLGIVTRVAQQMVREGMRQAARGGLSVPVNRPGTLVAWSTDYSTAQVTVDGDSFPIPVINALNDVVPIGTRVLVHFEPPQGVFLWRIIGTPTTNVRTWTAAWGGASATVGNSVNVGRYTQRGFDVRGHYYCDIGSTGVMATDELTITLPVPCNIPSTVEHVLVGTAVYFDPNTLYYGFTYAYGSGSSTFMACRASIPAFGTVNVLNSVMTTHPFSWAADDRIWIKFHYEAATP